MKFGWCAGVDQAETLKNIGYDYIECAVSSLNLEDEVAAAENIAKHSYSPLPITAWNILFPGGIKVVGPEVDESRIKRYIDMAVKAVEKLGGQRVVFGSGGARRVPEGWERPRAQEQIMNLLTTLADTARGTGVIFVVEALNSKECNIINSLSEAMTYVKALNRPEVRVLADFYHMDQDNESLSEMQVTSGYLAHIHVADTGRMAPGTGSYPYNEFLNQLKRLSYDMTMSCECGAKEFPADAAAALEFLRNKWRMESAI